MGLVVFWTDTAIEKLESIFDYYKTKVNIKFAQTIVDKIVDSTAILETYPKIGQVEELLKKRKIEFRYLLFENYKIIYWIS